MIEVTGLGRDYAEGDRTLTVLDHIDLSIPDGELLAITGPSGSGKSTLLALIAGLDRPTRGRVVLDGRDLATLDEDALARLRGRELGFVFQSFQLIPTLTALENVRVPAELRGDFALARRAGELLERVGLGDRAGHFPAQLSGGEMQRVALARASLTRPRYLLCDEPTGNLDSGNGERVLALLLELNRESTVVLVTHNPEIAERAGREVRLHDGRIAEIVGARGAAGTAGAGAAAGAEA
jgi:putative ABC transport system ATP-binding protein